jgi:hypothetical protein
VFKVSVKEAQINLAKTFTWTKKIKEKLAGVGKGLH